MIRHDCIQGEPSWLQARMGVITASKADSILTPGKLNLSKQAIPYIHRLIAEVMIGQPLDSIDSEWMQRGRVLEPKARNWYGRLKKCKVEEVGFLTTDDCLVGCSPDGLVGDDGGLEIKVPHAGTMIGYAIDPEGFRKEYRGQVQKSLWVTKRKWWDLLAWNPSRSIPNVLLRCKPDPTYQEALDRVLPELTARLVDGLEHIKHLGPVVGDELEL